MSDDNNSGNWVPPYNSSYYNTFGGGPSAMGPNAALVLPERDIVELVNHHHNLRHYYRRRLAWDKWDIYRENFGHLVTERIGFVHSDETVKRELAQHVDLSINLALKIIRSTSVMWKHGAIRTVENVSDGARDAFAKLVEESKFAVHAPGWNELANFLGPTTVVPIMRDDKLCWDTLLPHFYEAVPNPADPFGAPQAVIWDVRPTNYRGAAFHDNESREANYILLDAEAWTYARIVHGGNAEGVEVVDRVEHGLGFFPGATLRFSVSHEQDWWGHDQHRRLVDATINICRLLSSLSFVRKTQDKKLLTLIGDLERFPKAQVVKPEKGLMADTGQDGTDLVSIEAKDFDTSPEHYIQHITWLMNSIADDYGGSAAMDPGKSTAFAKVEFDQDALTEIRNSQIPFARDFEHELWAKAVAMAKAMRHPMADELPSVDQVKEGFSVQYPKLARSFADPRVETEYLEWGLRHGIFSYSDIVQRDNPTLTDEQAQERVLSTIEKQLPVIEALTKRDLSLNPQNVGDPTLETPAQQMGAMGPEARDADDDDDESNPNETED